MGRWFARRLSDPAEQARRYVEEIARLTASRSAIVRAYEIERRRIERDLHDGAQQFLVAATLKMGEAQLLLELAAGESANSDPRLREIASLLTEAHTSCDDALVALRQTVAGIHTTVLTDRGLIPALEDAIARLGLRVELHAPNQLPTLPEGVASSAYFTAMEALVNAVKYAPDARITLLVAADQTLRITVMDDGPGGAYWREGGGLSGIRERLAAFGGTLELSSPPGGPTRVAATIPLLLSRQLPDPAAQHPGSADRLRERREL